MYITDLAHKVRRGQEGRILDGNGSVGALPIGYASQLADPNAVYSGRGPRPKKIVIIDEEQAKHVREVFKMFLSGQSISAIARHLTQHDIPKSARGQVQGWHHNEVRRMLGNKKYIGIWTWGATRVRRGRGGKRRQVVAPESPPIESHRPELRIIDQDTWDKAQERLRVLSAHYGARKKKKCVGRQTHYSKVYPKSLLSGLLFCGECGATFTLSGGANEQRYGCSGRLRRPCPMKTRVPKSKAESEILETICQHLLADKDWIKAVFREALAFIREEQQRVPEQIAELHTRENKLTREIENLAEAVGAGGGSVQVLVDKLTEKQAAVEEVQAQLAQYERRDPGSHPFPDEAWLHDQLQQLPAHLREHSDEAQSLLRRLIDRITVTQEIPPGKKRGWAVLRFRIHGAAMVSALLSDEFGQDWSFTDDMKQLSDEIVLPLGKPSRMDIWAPRIDEMRRQGLSWRKIGTITGLGSGNALTAWKRRYGKQEDQEAQGEAAA